MSTTADAASATLALARWRTERAAHVERLRATYASVPMARLAAVQESSAGGCRTRLRRGAYVGPEYDDLPGADKLIVLACAVTDAAIREPLFSHATAAAVWGLPMIGALPQTVEYLLAPGARGRSPNVRRRRTALDSATVTIGGLRVTTHARTVIDHARHTSLESSVAVCDDALHRGMTSRAQLLAESMRLPKGARGRRMAALAVDLADPRAESPLESLSRTRVFQAGLPRPELQVTFRDSNGFVGRTDFHWPSHGLIGECDGAMKYAGADAARALLAEKEREGRLRRLAEVRDVVRWNWDDAMPAGRLYAVLSSFGLRSSADGTDWPVTVVPLPRRAFVA